ncbi:DUF4433 domain-containing protein [Thermodesulfobacteriota bacterium]
MTMPKNPKIYHIVHMDRLPSIIAGGCLWCDAAVLQKNPPGTTIGMSAIKNRRLNELTLTSHPGLHIGDCVPFYFCPRSIMLYLIYKANHPDLGYRGGQGPIVHLEADLRQTVAWAEENGLRWAFTLSNAGSRFFEDRCDLAQLGEIEWDAVRAVNWKQYQEDKQAEFLIERQFPWELISRIGVFSQPIYTKVSEILQDAVHEPRPEIVRNWYYP